MLTAAGMSWGPNEGQSFRPNVNGLIISVSILEAEENAGRDSFMPSRPSHDMGRDSK